MTKKKPSTKNPTKTNTLRGADNRYYDPTKLDGYLAEEEPGAADAKRYYALLLAIEEVYKEAGFHTKTSALKKRLIKKPGKKR